jgi:hypothetical protein
MNTIQIEGLKGQVYVKFKTEQNVVNLISRSTTKILRSVLPWRG